MNLFLIGVGGVIAVVIITVTLSRRNTSRPQRHRHRAPRSRAERARDDEQTEQWVQAIQEVPEVTHEEFLSAPLAEAPAYPPPDEFLTVPVRPAPESPRRVRAQVLRHLPRARVDRHPLPRMLAPAMAAVTSLAAMAQRVAANERRENALLRAANHRLSAEIDQRDAEIERLEAEAVYPDLSRRIWDGSWEHTNEFRLDIEAMDEEMAA